MKAKLLVIFISILVSNSIIASGYHNYKGEGSYVTVQEQSYQPPLYRKTCSQEYGCGESPQNNCAQSGGCGGYSNVNCNCSDPSCFSGNPCLVSGKCCDSFVNIGSSDFSLICTCRSYV